MNAPMDITHSSRHQLRATLRCVFLLLAGQLPPLCADTKRHHLSLLSNRAASTHSMACFARIAICIPIMDLTASGFSAISLEMDTCVDGWEKVADGAVLRELRSARLLLF